jgi:hypothetical protein
MHARELVDLAAVVAAHAPALLREAGCVPEQSVEAYWTASKSRLDRWGRLLKRIASLIQCGGLKPNSAEHRLFRGVLEEILASEVLTRVWSAAMCAYDRAYGEDQMEPVARSVLIGQIEARHRVLTILVGRTGLAAEESMRLDALRRRTERWADLLVGRLAMEHDVCQFAVDPDRAREFADDFVQQSHHAGGRFAWPMVLASLRASFCEWLEPASPNPDLNARIAASILACFPAEVFDGLGTVPSEWTLRIAHIVNEAEGWLEELLGEAGSPGARRADLFGPGRLDRWHRFGG